MVVGVCVLAGCQRGTIGGARGGNELFSVDFKQGQILRYKQVSEREVQLDFDPGGKISKGGDKGRMQTTTERLEIVVAYKQVKVDSDGFSVIEAAFEQVRPSRSSLSGQQPSGKDATSYLQGKTVTFTLSPSGMITDQSGLKEMITKLGEEAFGGKGKGKGIKDPDMIQDFMTLEWMMWDAISSIQKPAQGVAVGEKWESQLMAPMPVPMRLVRDTTYTLERIEDINGVRIADINSVYMMGKNSPSDWPIPYTGSFQMRGVFGFLGGYNVLSITGSGSERFNISAGRVENISQQYQMNVSARMPFGLGAEETTPSPNMIVRQKLSVEFLH
jgi:hypothetical protein